MNWFLKSAPRLSALRAPNKKSLSTLSGAPRSFDCASLRSGCAARSRRAAFLLGTLSLLLALLPAPAPASAQTSGPTYTVQSGDTFYGIAQQFGITQEVLHLANPTVDPALLSIGQALIIPGFEESAEAWARIHLSRGRRWRVSRCGWASNAKRSFI